MDVDEHLRSFVEAFVEKKRRDKWLYLLSPGHRSKIFKHSAKLMDHIDEQWRSTLSEEPPDSTTGVFFDFYNPAEVTTWDNARSSGRGNDAIFSIVAGKHAVLFSHEGDEWELRRPAR